MKKYLTAFIFILIAFTSCGKTVGTDSDISEVSEVSQTETSSTSTEKTTEIHTTTKTSVTSVKAVSNDVPESVVLVTADTVEVYEDVTIAEFVTDTNVEIIYGYAPVDTSELGEKSVDIVFEYEGGTYRKTVEYTVADTTEPLVLNSGWNPYSIIGQPFDVNSVVGFVDNYDRNPTVTYMGDVDTSTVGAYPISVTVTDSSGNYTSWDMTVFVVNEKPNPSDDNTRVNFSDFMNTYNYENISYGIDVSAWQTNVNYDAVKAEGVEFVLMRIGYCYGNINMDDYYYSNIQNATDAGLDVGVYFYTNANTEEKAREQVQWIVEQLDGRKLDFPVAFDWEEWENFQQYGININDINNIFYAFCDELEKAGYSGMLYSSKNFLESVWENRINRPVWLAHYVDETNYTGDYAIWQASAYGRINGIDGDVDMNIRYNNMPLK
ncbi:MAG: glycoside hydrolase family 25 [Ruminococcus sp.]|nr:glycoside hydrolase family 25 [Ruminococcus sp.]